MKADDGEEKDPDGGASTGPPPTAATDYVLPDAMQTASSSLGFGAGFNGGLSEDQEFRASSKGSITRIGEFGASSGSGFRASTKENRELHAFITAEDPDGEHHTPRTKSLLAEAEVRAEHQAVARITMLDLAKALEEAGRVRRDLEVQINEEKRVAQGLRKDKRKVEVDLEESEEREEKVAVRRLKELYPHNETLWYGASWFATHAYPLSVMAPEAKLFGPRPKDTKTDWLAAKPYFNIWKESIAAAKSANGADTKMDDMIKKFEDERRRMQEEFERKLAEEKKISAGLDAKLQQVLSNNRQLELQLTKAADDYAALKKAKEESEMELRGRITQLENELAAARTTIAEKERLLDEAEQALLDAEDKHKQMVDQYEKEKRRLQGELKRIQAELAETIIALKQMKEAAMRSKRDAAGGISPEKYAQLIADLEEMRDRINALTRDSEYERENAAWLRSKLDQNKRRLELERQFLPLLHKVSGPVGPKNAVLKGKNNMEVQLGPPPLPPATPGKGKRLSHSASAGAIDGGRRSPIM